MTREQMLPKLEAAGTAITTYADLAEWDGRVATTRSVRLVEERAIESVDSVDLLRPADAVRGPRRRTAGGGWRSTRSATRLAAGRFTARRSRAA